MSNFFAIPIDFLLNKNLSVTNLENSYFSSTQSIAIISWQHCINLNQFIKNLTPNNWNNWVISEYVSNNAFGLLSKPSMEPRFPKGSILIIQPDTAPVDGDLVIVHYPKTDEATIRTILIDGPSRGLIDITNARLTSLNKEITILGVLVKSVFSYH